MQYRPGADGCADADHGDPGRVPYEGSGGEDADGGAGEARSGILTLPEFIYSTYNNLLEGWWRMREIDEMDLLGFLRIRAWNAKKKQEKQKPRRATIDTVWPGLKP